MALTENIPPEVIRAFVTTEQRRSMCERWVLERRMIYRAVTDQFVVKGVVFDADRVTDETTFATISLLVNA